MQLTTARADGSGLFQKLRDRAGRDRVGVARFAVTLGGGVPVHLVTVDVDDHHTVLETVQRTRQPVALLIRQIEWRNLGLRGAQPNLPVM